MNYVAGMMRFDNEGKAVSSLSGSMLWLRPAIVTTPQWQENFEACVEYRNRFGTPISLPFWFANSMTRARELVEEALEKNRRRWILECGPWGCNPPISEFIEVVAASGRNFESLSLGDTACLWLDPVEWLEVKPE